MEDTELLGTKIIELELKLIQLFTGKEIPNIEKIKEEYNHIVDSVAEIIRNEGIKGEIAIVKRVHEILSNNLLFSVAPTNLIYEMVYGSTYDCDTFAILASDVLRKLDISEKRIGFLVYSDHANIVVGEKYRVYYDIRDKSTGNATKAVGKKEAVYLPFDPENIGIKSLVTFNVANYLLEMYKPYIRYQLQIKEKGKLTDYIYNAIVAENWGDINKAYETIKDGLKNVGRDPILLLFAVRYATRLGKNDEVLKYIKMFQEEYKKLQKYTLARR